MTLLLAVLLAHAPAADRPPRCEALYQEGRRLYFDGRFEEAPGELRAAPTCAREEWGHDDTLSQRHEGLCFQYEDRLDEALALFRAAAEDLLAPERSRHDGELRPGKDAGPADALNNVGWALYLTAPRAARRCSSRRGAAKTGSCTSGTSAEALRQARLELLRGCASRQRAVPLGGSRPDRRRQGRAPVLLTVYST